MAVVAAAERHQVFSALDQRVDRRRDGPRENAQRQKQYESPDLHSTIISLMEEPVQREAKSALQ